MSEVDPFDPVGAYVKPIRSVLFVDDHFPTYGQATEDAAEAARARALWKACSEHGWLCDIDNSAEWTTPERRRRLASCDLLVLDYHLLREDTIPTLSIIRDLARDATPNLVVVYTNDPDLDKVLLATASWARGVTDAPVPEELEELEDAIEWTLPEHFAFLSGKGDWKASLKAACVQAEIAIPDDQVCAALLERRLRHDHRVEVAAEALEIEGINHVEHRWFRCGNLFVVVMGKPKGLEPEKEAEAFRTGLEGAVRSWNPHWLACLMAHSRRHVETGAFRDDILPLEEPLQNGLLWHIRSPNDPPERRRLATEIATHLLSRRSLDAAKALGKNLQDRAASLAPKDPSEEELFHLNAFLCSEPFRHHHLNMGTIFVFRAGQPEYWVCVTPACDMVPRAPNGNLNPWAFDLDPYKPLVALRLKPVTGGSKRREALTKATLARHLFFWDRTRVPELVVAACFKDTADPNPWLEQMLAIDRARVQDDGSVRLYRFVAKKNEAGEAVEPRLEPITCEPVAQLRAPYAERVVQVVGGHVSRIGVDFVPFKPPK